LISRAATNHYAGGTLGSVNFSMIVTSAHRPRPPQFPRDTPVVRALSPPLHARRAIHGPGGLFLVLHRAAGQFLYLTQVSKNPLQPELCQRVLSFRAAPLEEAQQVITRIEPQQLRDSVRLRQMVARDFEQIQAPSKKGARIVPVLLLFSPFFSVFLAPAGLARRRGGQGVTDSG
jgi:hypothetical protein